MSSLIDLIRDLAIAFYQSILKLSINAQQVIAAWRVRINRRQSGARDPHSESINLSLQKRKTESANERNPEHQKQPPPREKLSPGQRQSSQTTGLSSKTHNSRRSRFFSLISRLPKVRNLMEYCVIALNEASSSGCPNKLDLSTCNQPVWLLGRQYKLPLDVDKLIDDIRSRIWITYRKNFPPLDDSSRYTTDRGFGCMIRCGQMVLANALLFKHLGRDWRWSPTGLGSNSKSYSNILRLFQDREECPYSIHNIVRTSHQEGKLAGEWFGPNTIAQALKRLATGLANDKEVLCNEALISIDAALDNVVVISEIKSKFKHNPTRTDDNSAAEPPEKSSTDWSPGILFIQLRLGLTKINPLYFEALRKTLCFENSLGIIGGRPNHALYFIGFTDEDIIYLDPHSTQQYTDLEISMEKSLPDGQEPLPIDATYHCACPEKIPLDKLDPSLALCFYFHTEQDFDSWCEQSNNLLIKSEQAPMFEIIQSRPSDWEITPTSATVQSESSLAGRRTDSSTRNPDKNVGSSHDCELFTVLKGASGDHLGSHDTRAVETSTSEHSSQTNDDEEFEMLG